MNIREKRLTLDAIESATPERMRDALRVILCTYYAQAAEAEENFSSLSSRELGEACVALEVIALLAGKLTPCRESFCARAAYACELHNRIADGGSGR